MWNGKGHRSLFFCFHYDRFNATLFVFQLMAWERCVNTLIFLYPSHDSLIACPAGSVRIAAFLNDIQFDDAGVVVVF